MGLSMRSIRSLAAAVWVAAGVATPPALPQESKPSPIRADQRESVPIIAVKVARLFDGKSDTLPA
jgi:hypothetical protein